MVIAQEVLFLRETIAHYIANSTRKTLNIKDFIPYYRYSDLVDEIKSLVTKGVLMPRGRLNGLKQSLYHSYTIHRAPNEQLLIEIRNLPPYLQNQYYVQHPKAYQEDKPYIDRLCDFYENNKDLLSFPATLNERAYQLVGNEKWLLPKFGGLAVLTRLGIAIESLNVFATPEPFHYVQYNQSIRTVLISENKDAFYDIKKLAKGLPFRLWNVTIDLLVWGEGSHIENSFEFMIELNAMPDLEVFYWGDLDYTGIGIFTRLIEKFPQSRIVPHCQLYKEMLDRTPNPPEQTTAVREKDKEIQIFLSFFDELQRHNIQSLLLRNRRVPQESVPFHIMSRLVMA